MINSSKYLMLQIMLNLYSVEEPSGLYYHRKPKLCNAMREFKIPWHIGQFNRIYFSEKASLAEVLQYDDPLVKGFCRSIIGEIKTSTKLSSADKQKLLIYAEVSTRVTPRIELGYFPAEDSIY